MGMNSGGSRFIVMSNNHIGSATVDGGASYLRAGFGIYNYDSVLDPLVPAVKLIRVGVLTNPDTSQTFPSTPIYGIQIGVRKPGVGYRDIFRADSLGNSKIAGVNFDNESMWTTNWRLNADGTANFGQWTVFDTYFYAGKNHISGPDFAGVYLMARPAPAEYYGISVGRNRTSHYISMFYNATNNSWGLRGYSGQLVFELGDTNKIAGWTFEEFVMWAGSKWSTSVSTGGISIGTRSDDRHFRAFLNYRNYVEMKYVSTSDWGLRGLFNGSVIFQLGNVNKIAGFTFDNNNLTGTNVQISPNRMTFRNNSKSPVGYFIYDGSSLNSFLISSTATYGASSNYLAINTGGASLGGASVTISSRARLLLLAATGYSLRFEAIPLVGTSGLIRGDIYRGYNNQLYVMS